MDERIKRGRILREILKQDLLSPQPVEFQMAWLVAYNEGLFDHLDAEQIKPLLMHLQKQVASTSLNIDQSRDQWRTLICAWLK